MSLPIASTLLIPTTTVCLDGAVPQLLSITKLPIWKSGSRILYLRSAADLMLKNYQSAGSTWIGFSMRGVNADDFAQTNTVEVRCLPTQLYDLDHICPECNRTSPSLACCKPTVASSLLCEEPQPGHTLSQVSVRIRRCQLRLNAGNARIDGTQMTPLEVGRIP